MHSCFYPWICMHHTFLRVYRNRTSSIVFQNMFSLWSAIQIPCNLNKRWALVSAFSLSGGITGKIYCQKQHFLPSTTGWRFYQNLTSCFKKIHKLSSVSQWVIPEKIHTATTEGTFIFTGSGSNCWTERTLKIELCVSLVNKWLK